VLATTFLPSAWVDDALIRERQTGLSDYLEHLLSAPEYAATPSLVQFLAPSAGNASAQAFNPEDALPSTLSRKDALAAAATLSAQASSPIAASYYPDWVGDSNPPESIDFSKFDILFFGPFATCLLSVRV
jgi:chitinase